MRSTLFVTTARHGLDRASLERQPDAGRIFRIDGLGASGPACAPYRGQISPPFGLRAMSAYHREHPYAFDVDGVRAGIDYEPAESTTAMFGGNSNWRGPLWFPLSYIVISALERYGRFFGDDHTEE